jgi:hypothetical protein
MAAPFRRFSTLARGWADPATTALAAALLALYWWSAVSASFVQSQTSDELPHLGAGLVYDRYGDFRFHPENGNLPQRLFGLPALATGARFPLDAPLWRTSATWPLCWEFFYDSANPSDWLLLCARSLNALFGVALGALLFGLARAWHGRAGALLALAFFAFAPNFLAHGALATSDLAAAFTLTLAPWLFWRHLQRRDVASGLLAGVASGLTLVAKHNGVLLAPIYAALVLFDAWLALKPTAASAVAAPPPPAFGSRLARNLGLAALQACAAVLVVWAFHDFRFSPRGPGAPDFAQFGWDWPHLLALLGPKRHLLEWALELKLLPEAWLYGLANVLGGAAGRPTFFAGEHSLHGWWYFFPALFLLKTPLALLAAFGLALGCAGWRLRRAAADSRRRWLARYAPLLAAALAVGLSAVTSRLNLGDRHILAVYPVFFVTVAALGSLRWAAVAAAVLLAGHAGASLAVRPHYLASFNLLAGGPARAHRIVADSSLDWGQDLPALHAWLARHRAPGEPFYLGYFGSAWPPHYGVRPTAFLTTATFPVRPPPVRSELQPGLYALSATVLVETYARHRGPWTPQQERDYRDLRARFAGPAAAAGPPPAPPGAPPPADAAADSARYDELRFARLCKFLQRREPDALAGYSILLFRLTAADLRTALEDPVVATHRLRLP